MLCVPRFVRCVRSLLVYWMWIVFVSFVSCHQCITHVNAVCFVHICPPTFVFQYQVFVLVLLTHEKKVRKYLWFCFSTANHFALCLWLVFVLLLLLLFLLFCVVNSDKPHWMNYTITILTKSSAVITQIFNWKFRCFYFVCQKN